MTWLLVALAGGLGAVARYVVDHLVMTALHATRPWGTWTVNMSGSLLAGVAAGAVTADRVSDAVATVVAGGFLGAYTTFSTAMVQAATQLGDREHAVGIGNLVGTLLAGIVAAALGLLITAG